ncbi:uncharacterized protein LOC127797976 [Diospyros lotus]|uniref:uncharacterized protein LOC127797976 n=1 Tax=Diospyros lotus TaxID=55363 RepID=UPI002250C453|nr:uncharacterized protein LOC127797976 [Diospyros lotus]
MLDILVALIAGAFTLCAAIIQGPLAARGNKKSNGHPKKSNGTEANRDDTGILTNRSNKKSNGHPKKSNGTKANEDDAGILTDHSNKKSNGHPKKSNGTKVNGDDAGILTNRNNKKSNGHPKKSNGTEANEDDTGILTNCNNKKSNGHPKKSNDEANQKLASLKEAAKNLTQKGKKIRRKQHEVVNSYRSQVTALMLLSLFYGVASIYLQLSYTDEVKMTILFFFAFGVALRTALTKLEKISQLTGDLRTGRKDLQERVKAFKGLFGKRSDQIDRQIAGLEKAMAEAMELSKSIYKQANSFDLFPLPLAACAVACGRCIPGLSLLQFVQLLMGSVFLWWLASTHPTLLLSTILQGCLYISANPQWGRTGIKGAALRR